ncbi:hypothetical protein RF11_05712 [Thelohanellus kitauei]|uniref:Uncharacterized protein n=1 Tax=Thelohanellus kitauei TaxID=669202 RepID=A0A0C2MFC7_THEKT|nr:hypothetical protein RF11_05712 [Thelohanellus kitauei]
MIYEDTCRLQALPSRKYPVSFMHFYLHGSELHSEVLSENGMRTNGKFSGMLALSQLYKIFGLIQQEIRDSSCKSIKGNEIVFCCIFFRKGRRLRSNIWLYVMPDFVQSSIAPISRQISHKKVTIYGSGNQHALLPNLY